MTREAALQALYTSQLPLLIVDWLSDLPLLAAIGKRTVISPKSSRSSSSDSILSCH